MRSVYLACVALLGACAPEAWSLQPRPADYQPPPGSQQLVLSGPDTVDSGTTETWVVTAPDLVAGTRVHLAWGDDQGPGRCPLQGTVGGWLCLDIVAARLLSTTTAVVDPLDPSRVIASFDIVVPPTSRTEVHLQALSADGSNSATTQPFPVYLNVTPPPATGGLLAWWDFEGDAGDRSGNGHDGTLTNGAALVPGQVGTAVNVTGAALVDFPITPAFQAATELTVTAWASQSATAAAYGVIAKAPRGGGVQDWGFYLSNTAPAFDANFPCCEVFFQASSGTGGVGWHHVAGTYSSIEQLARFYVNGVLVDTVAAPALQVTNQTRGVIGTDAGSPNDFSGLLDEVTVWSRVLDEEEIAQVMAGNIQP